jgi:hypothetical protein
VKDYINIGPVHEHRAEAGAAAENRNGTVRRDVAGGLSKLVLYSFNSGKPNRLPFSFCAHDADSVSSFDGSAYQKSNQ